MIYLYIYLIFNSFLYASFVKIFVNYKRNYIQCEKYTKNYVIKRKKQNVVCYAAFTIYEFYIYSIINVIIIFIIIIIILMVIFSFYLIFCCSVLLVSIIIMIYIYTYIFIIYCF